MTSGTRLPLPDGIHSNHVNAFTAIHILSHKSPLNLFVFIHFDFPFSYSSSIPFPIFIMLSNNPRRPFLVQENGNQICF